MSVSSTTAKVTFAGNNSTTVFNFSFTIFLNSDLVVTFRNSSGVESTLSEGSGATNYSVSVSSLPGNGSITYPASGSTKLQANERLTIKRVLPLTQTIDLQNQGGYFPDVQETGFDKGVLISQQIDEEVDRSVKLPIWTSGVDPTLPVPTANTVFGWNSDATSLITGPTIDTIAGATASAAAAATSASQAATHLDTFQDIFLGAASSDPSTDLDGNALQDGAIFFDTTLNVLKVFDLGNTVWKQTTPTTSQQTNIDAAVADATDIGLVAGSITNVNLTGGSIANVNAVAADQADIGTVASNLNGSNTIGSVAGNITNVNAVAGNSTNINAVNTDPLKSNINAVAADASDIGTVATDLSGSDNIGTTASNIGSVNTTAGAVSNINTTASNISSVNSVAAISTDVSAVAAVASQVSAVAAQFVPYTFSNSTNTSTNPGSGRFTYNNVSAANTTEVAVSDIDKDGTNTRAYILYFDDSTNVSSKGTIVLRSGDKDVAWYNITSLSAETGFVRLQVTFLSGSPNTFSNNEDAFLGFSRTGDKGADGAGSGDVSGPGSATNNALARFDTTTGKLLQNSTATLSDSGALSTANVTLTGSTQHGVLLGGGSGAAVASTALGSAGQALTSNGAGSAPTYQDIPGGPGVSSSGTAEFIRENAATISGNVSITAARNAFSAGPITIASSATVTIPANSRYHIIG
jgi:hypothetical protein